MKQGRGGQERRRPRTWRVMRSVLAAFFGVQSERNRQRDFTEGRAIDYILAGLVAAGLLVLVVAGVVWLVLRLTT